MLWLRLDRSRRKTFIRQVYEQIRDQILRGELAAGQKIPSTRELAREYRIARNILIEVYEQLLAEGYLETRKGAGTYVAAGLELEPRRPIAPALPSHPEEEPGPLPVPAFDFSSGIPALYRFPRQQWGRLLREAAAEISTPWLGYSGTGGLEPLKSALARLLLKSKGIRCHPAQIFIFPGSFAALWTIFNLLAPRGGTVILEDPVYAEIRNLAFRAGLDICPVPVDEQGLDPALIPAACTPAFVHVIPSHQFPTGSVLSVGRRIQLIDYARRRGIYLVENDYDSEFRYSGVPVSSLCLLDPQRVIHIGTFSETMFPALRIGYMVIPPPLLPACLEAREHRLFSAPAVSQLALAKFLERGMYERHISRMRRHYKQKHRLLTTRLREVFGSRLGIKGDSTGLFFVIFASGINFAGESGKALAREGLRLERVAAHALDPERHAGELILGFGNIEPDRLTAHLDALCQALTHLLD